MTDYQGFIHGGTTFPLATATGRSLLRDADPAVFYTLEFFSAVLTYHLNARLLEEVAGSGAAHIAGVVAEVVPYSPEPYLVEGHFKFPLLGVYRKQSAPEYVGQRKVWNDQLEVAYVLPPMKAGEAERILPMLRAALAVLDNRAEQGFDPAYTPTTPTGTAGEEVWSATRAGVTRARITGAQFGGYSPSADLYFPAVTMTLEMRERSEALVSEFGTWAGANVDIVHAETDGTVIDPFIEVDTFPAPTVTSITPDTGTKAGGTNVTVGGTNFVPSTLPTIELGGARLTNVVVVNATTITGTTAAHAVYGASQIVDVEFEADDGQTASLPAAFTYTNP